MREGMAVPWYGKDVTPTRPAGGNHPYAGYARQDTPVLPLFAARTAAERAPLFTDAHVRPLPGAWAARPAPRQRREPRDDRPFLLTGLSGGRAAALRLS